MDCNKKCCTKKLGFEVCEPFCQQTCAAANVGCGVIQVPVIPGTPIQTPPISVPPLNGDVAATLLTGGMVNPVTKKATNDAIWNLTKAVKDIDKTVRKASDDTKDEAGRASRDIGDAGAAISQYVETKTKATGRSFNDALTRVREGKAIDAMWHLGTDQIQTEDKAASQAALKSDIVRTVGQVASTVYGGPGGAAAYAAWLAYHQSGGDINLALKVGIITGATSWAMQGAGTIPTQDAAGNMVASGVAKRVAVTGAIGGLAIAAAGGDENAVRDGFVKAGAMVLIQEGYRSYVKHELFETDKPGKESGFRASKGDAYCTSSVINCRNPPRGAAVYDKSGKFIGWDQSKLDPSAPHVGNSFPNDPNAPPQQFRWPTTGEGSSFMKGISKVPGGNAMGVFHDQWALDWHMPPVVLQATIYPAVVLTYNGTSAPLFEYIRQVSLKEAKAVAKQEAPNGYIPPVVYRDEAVRVPPKESQIETAYTCANRSESRSIAVEIEPKKSHFSCRVVYRSNFVRSIPWRAMHDPDYCFAKAKILSDAQKQWGYACMVATATPKAVASATPKAK